MMLETAKQLGEHDLILIKDNCERAGVSLYGEISEEIEVCVHQGMNVLGAVVVG